MNNLSSIACGLLILSRYGDGMIDFDGGGVLSLGNSCLHVEGPGPDDLSEKDRLNMRALGWLIDPGKDDDRPVYYFPNI